MEDKEPLRGLRVLEGAWVLKILSVSTAQSRNHGLKVQQGKCRPACALDARSRPSRAAVRGRHGKHKR